MLGNFKEKAKINSLKVLIDKFGDTHRNVMIEASKRAMKEEAEKYFKKNGKVTVNDLTKDIIKNKEFLEQMKRINCDENTYIKMAEDIIKDIENPQIKEIKEMKVGRNSPCPCGSGKKYKRCCGL